MNDDFIHVNFSLDLFFVIVVLVEGEDVTKCKLCVLSMSITCYIHACALA